MPRALVRGDRRTHTHGGEEEPTMKDKVIKLAKRAAKLFWIELLVPGGTLVVLAILVARAFASFRSRRLAVAVPAPE
jgi:hypothetical protein